jgi:hypothetical protein
MGGKQEAESGRAAGQLQVAALMWYSEQSELAQAATSPNARSRSDSIYNKKLVSSCWI